MALTINCPRCQTPLRLSDKAAGRKAKCPRCEQVFVAPVPAPEPVVLTPEADAPEAATKPPRAAAPPGAKSSKPTGGKRPAKERERGGEQRDEDARRRRPAGSGLGIFVAAGAVVLLICLGAGIGFWAWSDGPASQPIAEKQPPPVSNEKKDEEKIEKKIEPKIEPTPVTKIIQVKLGDRGDYVSRRFLAVKKTKPDQWECHAFHVELEKGRTYRFKAGSYDFDLKLSVLNDSNQAQKTMAAKKSETAEIEWQAQFSGTHRIAVSSDQAAPTNRYDFTINRVNPGEPVAEKPAPSEGVVVFNAQNEFVEQGRLTDADRTQKLRDMHRSYRLPLVAGRIYTVDMELKSTSTFAILNSPSGKTVARDESSGSDYRSHFVHRATETGDYSLIVGTPRDVRERGNYTLSVRRDDAPPRSAPPKAILAYPPPKDTVAATVRTLDLPMAKMLPVWDESGENLFYVTPDHRLIRARASDFRTEVEFSCDAEWRQIGWSSEGLVALSAAKIGLQILDPVTLEQKTTIDSRQNIRFASHPGSPLVFGYHSGGYSLFNVQQKRFLTDSVDQAAKGSPVMIQLAAFAPDAKTLFAFSWFEGSTSIVKLFVSGEKLVYLERLEAKQHEGTYLSIPAQGQLLARTRRPYSYGETSEQGRFYSINDLKNHWELEFNKRSAVIGLDLLGGAYVSYSSTNSLHYLKNPQPGTGEQEDLKWKFGPIEAVIPRPNRKGALVILRTRTVNSPTASVVCYVERLK